jgi:hypothetical protein
LLANGRWFSPGTPASSTTKTGCHDIAEMIAESGIKHQKESSALFFCNLQSRVRTHATLVIGLYEL